jgi:uncharacterized protein (DUF58 family)
VPTARGWACIAAAGALLGGGAAVRIPELLEIGVALLALVFLQLARMRVVGRDYVTTRTIHPPRGVAGSPVTVEVTISPSRRTGRGMPVGLLYTDPVPQALGGSQRVALVVERPGPATVRYQLTPARRGRYAIGAGRLTATDPFGLIRSSDTTGYPSTFVVYPKVEALRGRAPAGTRRTGASTAGTAFVAATREWRPGDDMRRIHWRSTAHMGKVMVRQEELPRRDRATVVIDNRRSSYAEGWDGAEAFERAVEAAASLVHHFLAEGFAVRLIATAGGGDASFGKGPAHHSLLMTALATSALAEPSAALHKLGAGGGPDAGFTVVVGGVPEAAEGGRLVSLLQEADALVLLTHGRPDTRALDRAGIPALHLRQGQHLAAIWPGVAFARGRTRGVGAAS